MTDLDFAQRATSPWRNASMNREIAEIIRVRKPLTLPPTAKAQEACKQMHRRRVGAILVTSEKGSLIGIFTGRNAVHLLAQGVIQHRSGTSAILGTTH
jgi:CBS domain-containing protein